uniref:Ubiquitin-like protease family profile domain-containing protein n=1 Tax=Cucumis melo TaxID=3656 RepID=A0A9I9EH05_CUCME
MDMIFINLQLCCYLAFVGRIVIGLYGQVVPKTVDLDANEDLVNIPSNKGVENLGCGTDDNTDTWQAKHDLQRYRSTPKWRPVKCPRQLDSVGCGYYVQKYIHEIVHNSTNGTQPSLTPRRHQRSRNLELERYALKHGKITITIALGAEKPIFPHAVEF